jgi:4-diphosphocytidyl-2-C-methyl-D-erythritol kinase
MTLTRESPCKVNLILNILGRRADGFHELETVMYPVSYCDRIEFRRTAGGIELTCSHSELPVDSTNLVHRAAAQFLEQSGIRDGVRLHLEKRIPLAAGLGGGSGNAATTLLGLNELFGYPLTGPQLTGIAATLGSDAPFFLQDRAALATGRGEQVLPLGHFAAFRDLFILLIHPGFGISTPWAYRQLAKFPEALNGRPGRARRLAELLEQPDLGKARTEFYNSLEAPALWKYPVLSLYQEFLRENGAPVALMSGSGSTTFALVPGQQAGESLKERFLARFGARCWTALVAL